MKAAKNLMRKLMAKPGKVSLKDFDPELTGGIRKRRRSSDRLQKGVEMLALEQDRLYAQDTYGS